MAINFDNALNPAQLEAVNFNSGPLLVVAGAGSGKTRTLTHRVARLVEDGVAPDAILLLTFTRKASQEMLKRATQLLDDRCDRVAGGTFHSFAHGILRRYGGYMGLGAAFTILDRADSEGLVSMLRKEMGGASKQKSFPKKQTLANIFSRAVNKVKGIDEIIFSDYPHFSEHLDAITALNSAYRSRKQEQNLLDYDDLLVYLQILLAQYPEMRERISSKHRYIMVDEYQDTNPIQAEIVYLLGQAHQNVMVVGDDSQSIYAFRGADFRNIMEFPKKFSGTKIIKLEENYRSVQPILSLTNAMIEGAREKYTKNLFTRKKGGALPLLVDTISENRQSRFVVDKVSELQGQGVPLGQIAVLFRAGFHSFDLEIELNREAIPFVKVGGFKFMESAHIKDVLAHMRVLVNPYDRISWHRILLLIDKVGPKTAQNIYNDIVTQGTGYAGIFSISHKAGRSRGIADLKDLYAGIDSAPMGLEEIGETVLNYYHPILSEKYDDYPKRMRDLEHLLSIVSRYHDLNAFLADMALEPPTASIDSNLTLYQPDPDRLTLSTVHSAKGLEWHTVFVIWALDGRFPSIHALGSDAELEEELRLMYVAATRAKTNLFFSYPMQVYDRSSGIILSRPSRFLDAIAENILQRETVGIY